MLTRKTPDTFDTNLTITGQGQTISLDVTYFNRTQEQINTALTEAQASSAAKDDVQYPSRASLLYIVQKMDSEYPLTLVGIAEMESDRPGMIEALFRGYHKAREVQLAKN